ncbi:unnamed protein product, partial [Rotaria sordida]
MSNTQLITREVISSIILQTQVNDLVDNFRIQISTTLDRTLKLIRETSVGNLLVSGWKTDASAILFAANAAGDLWAAIEMNILPQSADGLPCYCSTTFQCRSQAAIYQETDPGNTYGDYATSFNISMIIDSFEGMKIYEDFRVQATGQFQLLQSFCELAEQTVVRALQDFATSEFITANVISATIFDAQMRSTINTFQLETPSAFISTLELIRRTTHGNAFMTVYASNWDMKIYEDFRVQATGQFQLLQNFCELAEQTVVRALQDFATSEFITANVISATVFDTQMCSTINTFQLETLSAFISTLELIRRTTHGNAFMTVYASNW